ncbi:transcription/RNA binding protein motif protein [Ranid herpesvirus 3]|uniref:Transcription/RNA binding protein motif protein n=1 Tax=Ranid herpesvirus 3 TaxID=1987509 RepID=A0A1X9T537_9VIRU|nr:transcription/RNA binding protein motif protein [Ranid herpesvirus 3]ARR28811.1 transcription/RNA binding protein motif protein [Ranid herpesvirus 3]
MGWLLFDRIFLKARGRCARKGVIAIKGWSTFVCFYILSLRQQLTSSQHVLQFAAHLCQPKTDRSGHTLQRLFLKEWWLCSIYSTQCKQGPRALSGLDQHPSG